MCSDPKANDLLIDAIEKLEKTNLLLIVKVKIINDLKKEVEKNSLIGNQILLVLEKNPDFHNMETMCKILNGMEIDIFVYYRLNRTRFGYSILRII